MHEYAGCGYGAEPTKHGATRVQFRNKDLRGWQEFAEQRDPRSTSGGILGMKK